MRLRWDLRSRRSAAGHCSSTAATSNWGEINTRRLRLRGANTFRCGGLSSCRCRRYISHSPQQLGAWYLVLMRHPFCRYDYTVRPGWRLQRYGLEQQAEIVRHTFQLRHGATIRGAFPREVYDSILPFRPSGS